jgi:hypothetical protein
MLSSKKSPRKSKLFRSRFLAAGQDAATLRDVRHLREYLVGQTALAVLQSGFLVALALFARTVLHLFARHGDLLDPWYLRLSIGGILVCFLLVGRRLIRRIAEIRELRADLRTATRRLEVLREELRGRKDV